MFIVCGYFHALMEALNTCAKDHLAAKLKIFAIWSFIETQGPLIHFHKVQHCFGPR